MDARTCPSCGHALETLVACGECGALLQVPEDATPFELLGLAPSQVLDERDLRKRLTRFTRLCHPDFHSADGGDEGRALAERNTARLNEAYETLAKPARRADWLVRQLGGPDERQEGQMPKAFLLEVLDWNETLEGAREGSVAAPQLEALEADLSERRAEAHRELERLLTPLPNTADDALSAARRLLNAIRYLDRALGELGSLRLARAE